MRVANTLRNTFAVYLLSMFVAAVTATRPCCAADALPRGEDVIDIPAVGDGLCVHNLFQSNMVIQRDRPIRVWGWAAPGEQVKVIFAEQEQSAAAAADRTWAVEFPAMPASSQPREMTIKGQAATLTLTNILIGDIWLLGGQSNMEHPLARVEDGDLEIAAANFQNIRILTVPAQNGPDLKKGFPRLQEWHGFFGTHYRKGDWDVCSPEIVTELSAIGYVFARRVHMATQIPIGVVDISRGGTTVETWIPEAVLREMDTPEVKTRLAEWDEKVAGYDPQKDLDNRVGQYNQWAAKMVKDGKAIPPDRTVPTDVRPGPAMDMNRPGNCYASMIAPIAGFPVKGAIWHQGYNNALQQDGHVMYQQVFPKMIAAWRSAFNDPAMPFGIISLCTDGPPQTLDNYLEKMMDEGIFIRNVQYKTFVELQAAGDKNIGFASSYDMRRSWYHPGLKVPVGERISRWALATQYGKQIDWQPPTMTEMKVEDGKIILYFNTIVDAQKDSPIEGFAIAGDDRRFQPATAEHLVLGKDDRNRPTYDLKVIVLTSPHVANPTQYRYAWGRNPMGNLTAERTPGKIPVATQRSDNWKLTEAPLLPDENLDNRGQMGKIRALLMREDMDRRLLDARSFIEASEDKKRK